MMKPRKNSKAEKAFNAGLKAAILCKPKSSNPYLTGKYLGLKNWFDIGYESAGKEND